jgi:hypothetical protein
VGGKPRYNNPPREIFGLVGAKLLNMGLLERFRSEDTVASRREKEDQGARAVTSGLRALAKLFQKAADVVEKKRLEDKGYSTGEKQFLERSNTPKEP